MGAYGMRRAGDDQLLDETINEVCGFLHSDLRYRVLRTLPSIYTRYEQSTFSRHMFCLSIRERRWGRALWKALSCLRLE